MKKFKFIAMALVAISMFSCSKESMTNESDGTQLKGEEAVVTLQFEGASSRALGPGAGNGIKESKLNNALIFFFDGSADNSNLVGAPKFLTFTTDQTKQSFKTTTAAKTVWVVVNTGVIATNFTTSMFKNVLKVADLKALRANLFETADNATTPTTQVTENLWMSGMNAIENGKASVTLNFISSKISVTIDDQRKNKNVASGKITIVDKSIAVLFSGAEGSFFGAQATQTNYYSGFNSKTAANVKVRNVLNTELKVAKTNNASNSLNILPDESYHFYVFPHNPTGDVVQPVNLTIKSEKITNGVKTDTYYSVLFNAADAFKNLDNKTMQSGKDYVVKLTLKGDVNNGDGGGSTDPETPVVDADVEITVTPAVWEPVVISKEFN